jgi:hypothetical protein
MSDDDKTPLEQLIERVAERKAFWMQTMGETTKDHAKQVAENEASFRQRGLQLQGLIPELLTDDERGSPGVGVIMAFIMVAALVDITVANADAEPGSPNDCVGFLTILVDKLEAQVAARLERFLHPIN